MVTIAITGGNGDVGSEAAKQLCSYDEVTKIIITCRSKAKAENTIDQIVKATGVDPSLFGYVLFDAMDLPSIQKAIEDFPKVDRILLNVGGLGKGKIHEKSGAVDCMVLSALGQIVLANGLIQTKKVTAGGRIVYIGGEIVRPVYSFKGLLPHYSKFTPDDIDWAIKSVYKDCTTGVLGVREQLGDYKNAKLIGQLYFSHLATVYPDIFIMTISPGAIGGKAGKGTGFSSEGKFPLNVAMKYTPWIFSCLQVTHDIETGAARLMDGCLVGETKWKPGSMVMSPKPFWGAKGDPVDNRPLVSYLKDEELAMKVYEKVNEVNDGWEKACVEVV